MAERRMFAKSVIGGARFLKMPATSRLLYFDLGMEADDDGYVEAFSVMRKTGATEDDLRVLVSKGFVTILDEDLVSYILDWKTNNQIRKDRYHPSIYKNIYDLSCKVEMDPPSELATIGKPDGNQTGAKRETESRLGKSRLDKDRTGESKEADKPPSHNQFVPPSVEEVQSYCTEKGYIIDPERFVDYYTSVGWKVGKNPMKDWRATVRSWNRKEIQNNGKNESKSIWSVGTTV